MKKIQGLIRQGDIYLKRVEHIPLGKPTKHDQLTIAYGEVTGHHHTLYSVKREMSSIEQPPEPTMDVIEQFITENGRRFVRLTGEWLLKHQEHSPGGHLVPPGDYEIVIERERDPFMENIRTVVD